MKNWKKEIKEIPYKIFDKLMAKRVNEILLISNPYDAFIMEEDSRIAERIIAEYQGLNLTKPPKIVWASTEGNALKTLADNKNINLILTMPRLEGTNAFDLCRKIKKRYKKRDLPCYLLTNDTGKVITEKIEEYAEYIDETFVWSGDTNLLVAIVKITEDKMNADFDTKNANVQIIILIEDSPKYYSSLLPLLYKELVTQTRKVMDDSLNQEDRIRRMRARPKILHAKNYEEALDIYNKYADYILSIFSDVRFKKNGIINKEAGILFLSELCKQKHKIPTLVLSAEENNRIKAEKISTAFINKNSISLHTDISAFLKNNLGFGDFIFKNSNGTEFGRASSLLEMERMLSDIPDDIIYKHAAKNEFSTWLMARSEVYLASRIAPLKAEEFGTGKAIRNSLVQHFKELRKNRQRGIVSDFASDFFDPDFDFIKAGSGSLGGKARGLAFASHLLNQSDYFSEKFPNIIVNIPKTLVIATQGFDDFIKENRLDKIYDENMSDEDIVKKFLKGKISKWIEDIAKKFISYVKYPLAVRSSSLLEDAQNHPCAGVYKTYMIPNSAAEPQKRIKRLTDAIKLVYASTYLEASKTFIKNSSNRIEEEKMGVIIQQVIGKKYKSYFYPAISGVAQSYNFYPVSYMKQEEGIAFIAAGLGTIVVQGGYSLRFSPRYPQMLPQFSTVDDILKNSQKYFYALNIDNFPDMFGSAENASYNLDDEAVLSKIETDADAETVPDNSPIKKLSSYFIPQDNKIKDGYSADGYPILTFANILKYNLFSIPEIITRLLKIGAKGMGCPIEIEFAVNLPDNSNQKPLFALLQIRPMSGAFTEKKFSIKEEDIENGLCYSSNALGNGEISDIEDIVLVNPKSFDITKTLDIASEIKEINKRLIKENRKYLLIGPGRWGSADRWLGIPVKWNDISNAGAIIETEFADLKADPSYGSHFFHNITSLGVGYMTVKTNNEDFIRWEKIDKMPMLKTDRFIKHIRLKKFLTIQIDGATSKALIGLSE
ncbi:MAG: phosphoenolpyruvate synthase PpsA [Deltaproteobacteria bacterium]|nr:phosphoenolpyruvate synthase PpsA [Deltaproteobacteria bacterium]